MIGSPLAAVMLLGAVAAAPVDHTLLTECERVVVDAKGAVVAWSDSCRQIALTAAPDGGAMLAAVHDAEPVERSWERLGDDVVRFRARYQSGLEVSSELSLLGSGGINQRLRFGNRGGDALRDLQVTISLADVLLQTTQHNDTLASYVYGFSEGGALAPDQGHGPGLGIYIRHAAISLRPVQSEAFTHAVASEEGQSRGLTLSLQELSPGATAATELHARLVSSSTPAMRQAGLDSLMYRTVWAPLRPLSALIERAIVRGSRLVGSVGWTVVLFALLVRLLTFPLNRWSQNAQVTFNRAQAAMAPEIVEAKATLSGAAESERILAIYKAHGVSPLSGLKGSAALLVQLPILLAFFGVTTEADVFRDASFLWVTDLAAPDRLTDLGAHIPLLGSAVNALPLALGAVGWLASVRNPQAGRSGLWLNLAFTVLFYPFAAALVLYWVVVNVAQWLEVEVARFVD